MTIGRAVSRAGQVGGNDVGERSRAMRPQWPPGSDLPFSSHP